MTANQHIFLAIAKLALSRLVLTLSGDLSDRAKSSNACVWTVQRIGLATTGNEC